MADVALGAMIVLTMLAVVSAFGRMTAVRQQASEATRTAAVAAARSGDELLAQRAGEALAPNLTIVVATNNMMATAHATGTQRIPTPALQWVGVPVVAQSEVPIAPYRSNR